MPKLPSYQDVANVSPAVKRDPGVTAPVEAFQSSGGIAAREFAPSLRLVADVVRQEEDRINLATVNDARRELLDFETEQTEWLSRQKGTSVFNAKAQLDKASQERLTKIRERLTNDRQRIAFDEIEKNWRVGFTRTTSRTIASEMDRHYDDTDNKLLEASSRAAQKSASVGEFGMVQAEWADQEKVIAGYADRKGLDETQRKTMLDGRKSNFHSGIALQLIADGNDQRAQQYLDANRNEFDADDSLKIQNLIHSRLNEKASEYRVAVADKMQDLESMGQRGVIPPKGFISDAEIELAYPKSPERVAQVKRRRDEATKFAMISNGLHGQSNETLQADMAKTFVASDPANFAEESRHNVMLNAMRAEVMKQREDDPQAYAASHGIGSVNPINWKNPEAVTEEMTQRFQTLKVLKDRFGVRSNKTLSNNEAAVFGSLLRDAPESLMRSYLGAVRKGIPDEAVYFSTMEQIRHDSPSTAMAGMLAALQEREYKGAPVTKTVYRREPGQGVVEETSTREPKFPAHVEVGKSRAIPEGYLGPANVAELVLRGQRILNPTKEDKMTDGKPRFVMPSDVEMRIPWNEYVGDAYRGFEKRHMEAYQAYREMYAAMQSDIGNYTGKADSAAMKQAAIAITGGVTNWNKKKIPLPWGMSETLFKDKVKAAWPSIKETYADQIPKRTDYDDISLEPSGGGKYKMVIGNTPVFDKDGGIAEIEVR